MTLRYLAWVTGDLYNRALGPERDEESAGNDIIFLFVLFVTFAVLSHAENSFTGPTQARRVGTPAKLLIFTAMPLAERIDHDLKEAMKAREAARLGALRMLKSAFKYAAIEKSGADAVVDDETAMSVIRKQIKQREDAAEGFEKGGRPEQAAAERAEIVFFTAYLPAALSPEELSTLVQEAIAEVGASLGIPAGLGKAQMGAVMKAVQAKAAGRADGRSLSAEVQKQLP